MSLILDALKRSEQAESPIAYAPADAHQGAVGQRLRPIVAALLGGALLGAGVVTWFLLVSPHDEASLEPSASEPSASEPSASAPQSVEGGRERLPPAYDQPAPLNPSSASQLPSSQTASSSVADPAKRAMGAAPLEASSPSRLVEPAPNEAATAVAKLNAQMWTDSQSTAEGAANGEARASGTTQRTDTENAPREATDLGSIAPPIDLEKAIAQAARAMGDRTLVPHAATMIENLSQQQKDRIPTLIYSAHDFQAEGSATVTLNGRRLKVGQRAGQVAVKDILVDSVILDSSGTIFRLTALNSWINM